MLDRHNPKEHKSQPTWFWSIFKYIQKRQNWQVGKDDINAVHRLGFPITLGLFISILVYAVHHFYPPMPETSQPLYFYLIPNLFVHGLTWLLTVYMVRFTEKLDLSYGMNFAMVVILTMLVALFIAGSLSNPILGWFYPIFLFGTVAVAKAYAYYELGLFSSLFALAWFVIFPALYLWLVHVIGPMRMR